MTLDEAVSAAVQKINFDQFGEGDAHHFLEAFASGLPGGLPALKAWADGAWQLVPVEATEAMAKASRIVTDIAPGVQVARITTWGVKAWDAMLAAAPPAPEAT